MLTFYRIGELSLMKNMLDTMEVLGVDPQDEIAADPTENTNVPSASTSSAFPSSTAPSRLAITLAPEGSTQVAASEKQSKKIKGLTPEQKQKLELMQQEQEKVRKERVSALSQKLLEKISVWTETDRSEAITEAFKKKMEVYPIRKRRINLSSTRLRS
jgi:hypothetical protein